MPDAWMGYRHSLGLQHSQDHGRGPGIQERERDNCCTNHTIRQTGSRSDKNNPDCFDSQAGEMEDTCLNARSPVKAANQVASGLAPASASDCSSRGSAEAVKRLSLKRHDSSRACVHSGSSSVEGPGECKGADAEEEEEGRPWKAGGEGEGWLVEALGGVDCCECPAAAAAAFAAARCIANTPGRSGAWHAAYEVEGAEAEAALEASLASTLGPATCCRCCCRCCRSLCSCITAGSSSTISRGLKRGMRRRDSRIRRPTHSCGAQGTEYVSPTK